MSESVSDKASYRKASFPKNTPIMASKSKFLVVNCKITRETAEVLANGTDGLIIAIAVK